MSEAVVVALITGGLALCGTLGGSYLANRKTAALISYRMEQLEKMVKEQNKTMSERAVQMADASAKMDLLEQRMDETDALNEEKNKVQNHRIDDLEKEVAKYHHG